MKAHRNLPYILLFSSFLLIGYCVGRSAIDFQTASWARHFISSLKNSPNFKPSLPLAAGQRNILVIGVDDLNAPRPRLESVWLVLYINDLPQVTLLPVYPAPAGEGAETGRTLEDLFQLSAGKAPDPVFLDALQASGLWWSGYILVDEVAVVEVVDLVSKMSANNWSRTSGVRAVAKVPPAWEDRSASLAGQAGLVQAICRDAQGIASRKDISHLLDLIPRHASTDLNLTRTVSELRSLLSHPDGFSCEFPTLSVDLQNPR